MTAKIPKLTAFIIRRAAVYVARDVLCRALERRAPGSTVTDFKVDGRSTSFGWNGTAYVIHCMGTPFPPGEIQATSAFATFGWSASSAWDGSNADHDIVIATGTDLKRTALGLTLLCAILCEDDNVISVVWGSSGVIVEASYFRTRLAAVSVEDPPLFLWVAIDPYRPDRDLGMITRGLADYTGRELNFEPHALHDLDTLVGRVYDFSEYLYLRGPVIKHGDTVDYGPGKKLHATWSDERLKDGTMLKSIDLRLERVT